MDRLPVTVVGSGISGLTSALALSAAGHSVEIVTAKAPLETTSVVAAAVWYPSEEKPRERTEAWSRVSLDRFTALLDVPESGVLPTRIREYVARPHRPAWATWVPGFRQLEPSEVPAEYGGGFEIAVPRIIPTTYLPYLVERLGAGGTTIVVRPPIEDLAELTSRDRLIVNCTGLGAGSLLGDDAVVAIRGQVVAVANPGLTDGVIEETQPVDIGYVFPRVDEVILGGTREVGDVRREPDPATTERILTSAAALEPRVTGARVIAERVGLRPGRSEVRVEAERIGSGWVVHNYGHGGSGYVLSWGCADDVVRIAAEISAG